MTGDFQQTPRSRVAEAEKQLRIARQCLTGEHAEIQSLLDDVTRDVKTIGRHIEAAERPEADDPAREPRAERSTGEASVEEGHSEEPHAR